MPGMNAGEERTPKLVRLSAEVERLALPQQSDKFVSALRQAVRDEKIAASYVEGRYELPKRFRYKSKPETKRKSTETPSEDDGTYFKRTPEMLILMDESYREWFDATKSELFHVEFPELRPENLHRNSHSPTAAAMLDDTSLELFHRGVVNTRERLRKQQAHGKSLATKRGFTHKSTTEENEQPQTSPHSGPQPIDAPNPSAKTPPKRERKTTPQTDTPKEVTP